MRESGARKKNVVLSNFKPPRREMHLEEDVLVHNIFFHLGPFHLFSQRARGPTETNRSKRDYLSVLLTCRQWYWILSRSLKFQFTRFMFIFKQYSKFDMTLGMEKNSLRDMVLFMTKGETQLFVNQFFGSCLYSTYLDVRHFHWLRMHLKRLYTMLSEDHENQKHEEVEVDRFSCISQFTDFFLELMKHFQWFPDSVISVFGAIVNDRGLPRTLHIEYNKLVNLANQIQHFEHFCTARRDTNNEIEPKQETSPRLDLLLAEFPNLLLSQKDVLFQYLKCTKQDLYALYEWLSDDNEWENLKVTNYDSALSSFIIILASHLYSFNMDMLPKEMRTDKQVLKELYFHRIEQLP